MKRLEKIFSAGKALIIFDSCGAPDMAESALRLEEIASSGADIIELGIPFSDPVADGAVIQAASQQALANGATLGKILDMAANLRDRHPDLGLVIFGYYNVFLQYGLEKLFAQMAQQEIDGILIVDLPFEERDELAPLGQKYGIPQIVLVGPSTDVSRAKLITAGAQGFVYCINARGVTGVRRALPPELVSRLEELRRISPVPVAAGFGISDAAAAREIAPHADAIVVGSAAVKCPRGKLGQLVAELKAALR